MGKKLVELVNLWAEYETDNPEPTIADFCIQYLSKRQKDMPALEYGKTVDDELAALVGRMSSFAEIYSKKALTHFGLKNVYDWLFLLRLFQIGTPKKSELIYDLLSEFASGIDVIKRLVKLGLVQEFPDENDKRSKRVCITEKGKAVIFESFPYMEKVSTMAFGALSGAEKAMLLGVLHRLDAFHSSKYKDVRNADLEETYKVLTA